MKKQSSNNSGKADAKAGDTNKGASTGLKVTPPGSGLRSDTKSQPSNTNRFPNGLS